jgi:hypothetical protein
MGNITQAIQGTDASGKMSSDALNHLGDAMHTLEDMTSPMHTTDDGTPLVWYGRFGSVASFKCRQVCRRASVVRS